MIPTQIPAQRLPAGRPLVTAGERAQKVRIPVVGRNVPLEPFVDLVVKVQLLGRAGLGAATPNGRKLSGDLRHLGTTRYSRFGRASRQMWQCAVHVGRVMVMVVKVGRNGRRRHAKDVAVNVLRVARGVG